MPRSTGKAKGRGTLVISRTQEDEGRPGESLAIYLQENLDAQPQLVYVHCNTKVDEDQKTETYSAYIAVEVNALFCEDQTGIYLPLPISV